MLHFQKFSMQIHCVQNSGAYIYIHRLLYAKSLSLNFRKFVVFMTVYARYIHSIFNFFIQGTCTAFSIPLIALSLCWNFEIVSDKIYTLHF